jgi:hypothetical protein
MSYELLRDTGSLANHTFGTSPLGLSVHQTKTSRLHPTERNHSLSRTGGNLAVRNFRVGVGNGI